MKDFENQPADDCGKKNAPYIAEVAVEQLTVYRYRVVCTDIGYDAADIALARFLAGEEPDLGPAEGEQHDLTTFNIGETGVTSPSGFDDWQTAYRPIQNPHRDDHDAPFDGTMFETYGPEMEAVRAADPACVWTLVDCGDDENLYVLSGLHLVNRLGYFITEQPRTGEEDVEILVDC